MLTGFAQQLGRSEHGLDHEFGRHVAGQSEVHPGLDHGLDHEEQVRRPGAADGGDGVLLLLGHPDDPTGGGQQGLDLRVVKARDFRIDIRDLEKVVDRKTKLIELSLVAMYNGFQHDLKAVCDLAHAHGARVYADIVQAAGAVPIDVKATGVDFCACSSFKWLMGDFGLGFFYAREDLLEKAITRSQWGYHSTSAMTGHFPPFDPDAETSPVSWTLRNDATGYFEVGSIGGAPEAAVGASLTYIHELGVDNIQRHRLPLLRRMRDEMPRLGFTLATPEESTSPIITFATRDGAAVQKKLQAANINARVSRYWVRLSPSVYNDMQDVERLLQALA